MVQIIQERAKSPSFTQKLGMGVQRGLETFGEQIHQKQTSDQLSKLIGQDISKLPPDMQQKVFEMAYGSKLKSQEFAQQLAGQKEIAGLKAQNKASAGGLTGQAIPQEISQAMNSIVSQFPSSSADELKMMMDKAGIAPIYSNPYVENRRRQDERTAASSDKRNERAQIKAEKIIDTAHELSDTLPTLDSSIFAMEDAIQNQDLSFFSPDNLAEITGLEFFRTKEGAQLKTAAKTYFINDLKSSGARPNQFIEKMLSDASVKFGRSREANQAVVEGFKLSRDLKQKKRDVILNLEKFYDDTTGYLPKNFGSLVDETMKPYIDDRLKEYENTLRSLSKQSKERKQTKTQPKETLSGQLMDVIGPDGQEYEIDMSEVGQLPEGFRLK